MQKYELMFIIGADSNNESSAKTAIWDVKKQLEDNWGKIYFDEYWGARNLAYTISKNNKWFYQLYNLEFDWAKIAELENYMNLKTEVIRYLFVKIEDEYKPFTKEELEAAEKVRYEEIQKKNKICVNKKG